VSFPLPFSLPPPPPFFPWTRPSPVLVARAPWRVPPRRVPSPSRALRAGRRRAPPRRAAPTAPLAARPPLPYRAPWRQLGRAASRARPRPLALRVLPTPGGGGPHRALPSTSRTPGELGRPHAPPLPACSRLRRALPASWLGPPLPGERRPRRARAPPRPRALGRTLGCALARPCPSPRPGLVPRAPARFACPRHAQRALVRATVVALRLTLVLIHFNCCLVNVLRRALRRATVHSNFIFINVLRRATIFLINIYYSAASRASSRDDSFLNVVLLT
jgi:hypothetical protein